MNMNITDVTLEIWNQYEKQCEGLLQENYDSVPLVNVVEDLKENTIVKFNGMIQDMLNPEYYLEKYEVVDKNTNEKKLRSGKYTSTLHCKETEFINYGSEDNVHRECRTFVVISVPGLNDWAYDFQKAKYSVKTERCTTGNKRSLDDEPSSKNKQNEADSQNKKICNSSTLPHDSTTTSGASHTHLLNLPIPHLKSKICHTIMYNTSDDIKLNDLVEVVGFLSFESNSVEIKTHNPPSSLIPKIHCISWKRIEHNNSIVGSYDFNMDTSHFIHLKKELHLVLTQLLLGDALAAEYLLYHFISKVYMSNDMLVLGKFALNISHIPTSIFPNYGNQLYEFIEMLLPKSHYLPMTLKNLNELVYIPKKDYECDCIKSGLLQLSRSTHLVLDETKLQVGQLNESGVRAVDAISSTIKWQKVSYDFGFYPMEYDCDIPFLILSEGKSCLPSDFHVRLVADEFCINTYNDILVAAKHFLNSDLKNNLRIYLTLARFANYNIEDNDITNLIENDFVQMRQEANANVEDLHQLLILARLISLSEGRATLDASCWKRACVLENDRKNRLQ